MKDGHALRSNPNGSSSRFKPVRYISALLLAACSVSAQAAVLTTTGTLPDAPAGAYTLFNFDVTDAGTTTLRLIGSTDAYLGLFSGTNVLSNATYIAQDDDNGGGLNSLLSLNLGVGSYTAWITTHGSFWNLSTNSITVAHDHTPMAYTLTVDGEVSASAVPEPASMALLGLGFAGLAAGRRRRKA